MLCYKCKRASVCNVFRKLHTISNNFTINDCNDFDDVSKYRYQKIADDDNLMKLIYDYFTDNLEGVDSEQAKSAIITALWS